MGGIQKNVKAFWGLDSAKDRGMSNENRAIANSSSLPNLNPTKNSPSQVQYASQPFIREYSPHSAVEYGGGAIGLEPRKYSSRFELPSKSITPQGKSPPGVVAHREYSNMSGLEVRNPLKPSSGFIGNL